MQLFNALTGRSPRLSTLSWNIAAVNNNPFEYFLTHPDPQYEKLMADVEAFMEAPGDKDVAVSEVFTDTMYDDLVARMKARGWEVSPIASVWKEDLAARKIVGGFLKDKGLGAKRLMSMPDRFTNTIDLAGGGLVNRPTIISNYDGDMSRPTSGGRRGRPSCSRRRCRCRTKRAAARCPRCRASCSVQSRAPSTPRSRRRRRRCRCRCRALCLAVFDAILLHIVRTLSPSGAWLEIKRQIIEKLLLEKERRDRHTHADVPRDRRAAAAGVRGASASCTRA